MQIKTARTIAAEWDKAKDKEIGLTQSDRFPHYEIFSSIYKIQCA